MKEEKTIVNNVLIKYIFKEARYDAQQLIVIFSGFGGKSQFTYDFKSSLKMNRANVLWIKDEFFSNEHASYYIDPLRKEVQEKKIEPAIFSFICDFLEKLDLKKEQCTLLGCSKGATSALYYGLKYNFKNLIISAPTIKLGSFLIGQAPPTVPAKRNASFMLENINNVEHINIFDEFILDLLNKDEFLNKNIYLISSPADPKHSTQIKPYLYNFLKYHNFNYIESVSPLVRTHPDVTFHNAPLILSILGSLSFNLAPRYDKSIIGEQNQSNKEIDVPLTPVFHLATIFLEKNKMFIEGVYFLRGKECKEYSDLEYTLFLQSHSEIYNMSLAKGNKTSISKDYYERSFFNYDKAYFCTRRYQGLEINHIKDGEYKLSVSIKMKTGEKHTTQLPVIEVKKHKISIADKIFSLIDKDNHLYLKVEKKNKIQL